MDDGASAMDARLLGQTLGGAYRVLRRVGAGGMGQVYEAEHTLLGRHFALKVLDTSQKTRRDAVHPLLRGGARGQPDRAPAHRGRGELRHRRALHGAGDGAAAWREPGRAADARTAAHPRGERDPGAGVRGGGGHARGGHPAPGPQARERVPHAGAPGPRTPRCWTTASPSSSTPTPRAGARGRRRA